jgi:hypothetical protein
MPTATATPVLLLLLNTLTVHAAPLVKRDTSEYVLPKPVIVILIMLGAGLCVCVGFAIHSTFGFKGENDNNLKEVTPEQMEYMTEVRVRNMERLMAEGAHYHKGPRRGEVVYD